MVAVGWVTGKESSWGVAALERDEPEQLQDVRRSPGNLQGRPGKKLDSWAAVTITSDPGSPRDTRGSKQTRADPGGREQRCRPSRRVSDSLTPQTSAQGLIHAAVTAGRNSQNTAEQDKDLKIPNILFLRFKHA